MIKVSIIVPCYNVESKLSKCLNSIINQTEKSIEIICINNGSTDRTKEILDDLKKIDPRVIVTHLEKNIGASGARNAGIKQSNGEYLMFVDSDDWIENNMVELMLDKAQKNNVDIVKCGHFVEFDYLHKSLKSPYMYSTEKLILNKNFKKSVYKKAFTEWTLSAVWSNLYKKKIIQDYNILFKEDLQRSEDIIFNMEIFLYADSFFYLPAHLYHYMLYNDGLSITSQFHVDSIKRCMLYLKQIISMYGYNKQEERNLYYEKCCHLIIKFTRHSYNHISVNKFKNILSNEPFIKIIKKSNGNSLDKREKISFLLIKFKLYALAYLYNKIIAKILILVRPFIISIRKLR